jgi:hypothetical protein
MSAGVFKDQLKLKLKKVEERKNKKEGEKIKNMTPCATVAAR